jgi:hypothetical protein
VHRLNLFPLMHLNFFHMAVNLVAIAPLLERFEAEFGTLVTLALFTGPFGTLPGGIYTLLEKFVLRANTVVMGARYTTTTTHPFKIVYGMLADRRIASGSSSCCLPR